ncbi:hypothetical protein E6B08_18170 [Pseudomonas putida]|uniref:Uncharacterized protein n=1 Tax=Pseudomonas putida TaxID=303 RepID=A0A4D6XEI4_PSEPU|nr:hypothetical protein [Pseudomonas putida]QCI13180.1 hypothetical protein E6B08_18170 [Pseudomonas putida]
MQGPIELPPLIITPTNRPTQHRPGWGTHWIPHPSGTQFPAIPHAIAPPGKPARTPAVNPAVSAADKIQASFKKITPTEFGKTKKQIEALIAAQLKTSIYRNLKAATRKQYIVEDLLILRLDQGAAADKIAKKWLGYSIESRPNRVNVANYEKRYGKPQKDIERFKQRFTASYRAVAAKAQSMVEYFHLYTQVATSPTDKIRARHRAQHAAAAKAEAARVAAAKAKAEADRIAAAKAKAEADRIAAAKANLVIVTPRQHIEIHKETKQK